MTDTRCLNKRGCPNVGGTYYVSTPGDPLHYYRTRACTHCWRGYLMPGPPYIQFAEAPLVAVARPFVSEASIQPT